MELNIKRNKNLVKLGAAAVLSLGILSACGDDTNDDVDVIEPPAEVEPDDGTDSDVDIDVEDDNINDDNVEDDNLEKDTE